MGEIVINMDGIGWGIGWIKSNESKPFSALWLKFRSVDNPQNDSRFQLWRVSILCTYRWSQTEGSISALKGFHDHHGLGRMAPKAPFFWGSKQGIMDFCAVWVLFVWSLVWISMYNVRFSKCVGEIEILLQNAGSIHSLKMLETYSVPREGPTWQNTWQQGTVHFWVQWGSILFSHSWVCQKIAYPQIWWLRWLSMPLALATFLMVKKNETHHIKINLIFPLHLFQC